MNKTEALELIEQQDGEIPEVAYFVDFIRSSKRGMMPGVTEMGADVGNMADRDPSSLPDMLKFEE